MFLPSNARNSSSAARVLVGSDAFVDAISALYQSLVFRWSILREPRSRRPSNPPCLDVAADGSRVLRTEHDGTTHEHECVWECRPVRRRNEVALPHGRAG